MQKNTKSLRVIESCVMMATVYILATTLILPAFAISNINNAFSTYSNVRLGIKIDYPTNWYKQDKINGVRFIAAPDSKVGICCQASITISPLGRYGGATLEELANQTINKYTHTMLGFVLINSQSITIAGNLPAQRIVYKFIVPTAGNMEAMDIGAIKGQSVYIVQYFALAAKYQSNLPLIQKMIDSLQIL